MAPELVHAMASRLRTSRGTSGTPKTRAAICVWYPSTTVVSSSGEMMGLAALNRSRCSPMS
jgi:hypothetical protein